jgi:methylated-DNA-[protein]-cysteine S-methyltransferase
MSDAMEMADALERSARERAALAAARLVQRAAGEGLLDVAYTVLDTPVGPLLVAGTERGLVRVAFDVEGHDRALEQLSERISPRVLEAPARLDEIRRELDEYFEGRRQRFDVQLDWSLTPESFRRRAQEALLLIPYGETRTYGQLAAEAGNPRAVRAAGTACATNNLPVVVPCHRVVRTGGALGNYGGTVARKQQLLALEGAILA